MVSSRPHLREARGQHCLLQVAAISVASRNRTAEAIAWLEAGLTWIGIDQPALDDPACDQSGEISGRLFIARLVPLGRINAGKTHPPVRFGAQVLAADRIAIDHARRQANEECRRDAQSRPRLSALHLPILWRECVISAPSRSLTTV